MKIAIPTNDGLHIADNFATAKGFVSYTINLGEITEEEISWKKGDPGTNADSVIPVDIRDCAVMLVKNGQEQDSPGLKGIQITPVPGTILTSIIWNYLSSVARKEADSCCCP